VPQIPGSLRSGRVAVRLSEAGPRLRLLLIKAETEPQNMGETVKSGDQPLISQYIFGILMVINGYNLFILIGDMV
jgi:hypothetical protein